MKTIIGVYESYDAALEVLRSLQDSGYPSQNVSLLCKAENIYNQIHIRSHHNDASAEICMGAAAASVIGLLSDVGVFAVPGMGYIYGAGAIVGAFGSIDPDLIDSAVIVILTAIGIEEGRAYKYEKYLSQGRFLVCMNRGGTEIQQRRQALMPEFDIEFARQ